MRCHRSSARPCRDRRRGHLLFRHRGISDRHSHHDPDAPMSTTALSATLLAHIAKAIPQVRYAKIEVPGTADKLRTLIDVAGPALTHPSTARNQLPLSPTSTPAPSAQFRARWCGPACIHRQSIPGTQSRAKRTQHGKHSPLIHFENRQCGLRAQKFSWPKAESSPANEPEHRSRRSHPKHAPASSNWPPPGTLWCSAGPTDHHSPAKSLTSSRKPTPTMPPGTPLAARTFAIAMPSTTPRGACYGIQTRHCDNLSPSLQNWF